MQTTVQFLDAVRVRHGLPSDYKLAKFLGVSQSSISHYRRGQSMMDEAMCLKIAAALGVEQGEVLVAIAFEREKRAEVKRAWQRVAQRLASVAGAILIGLPGLSLHNLSGAPIPAGHDLNTHMRQITCLQLVSFS